MSDSAYQNALAEKARLIKALEVVESFLTQYELFAGKGGAIPAFSRVGKEQSANAHAPILSTNSLSERQKNSVPERFKPIIRKVLLDNRRPMVLGTLLTALDNNGTPIPGEHKAKNLGTVLWRLKDDFVNIPGHGYWPADIPHVQAGYVPPAPSNRDLL